MVNRYMKNAQYHWPWVKCKSKAQRGISPHTCQDSYYQKKKKKKGKRQQVLVRILVEKLEPFIVCGDAKWCSWYGKQNGDTFKY